MRRLLLLLAAIAGCARHGFASVSSPHAAVAPVWVGEMSSPTCRVFALERTPRGGAPRWLRLGDHWDGYVLVGYDRHPETLVLRRGGDTVRLVLDRGPVAGSAAVVSVAPVPPPRARAVAAAEVRRREGWVSATECAQPQRHGTQWWVLVRHAVDGRSEARMVILSADGRVLDYWRV